MNFHLYGRCFVQHMFFQEMPRVLFNGQAEHGVLLLFSYPSKLWHAASLQIFVSFHNQAPFSMFIFSALCIPFMRSLDLPFAFFSSFFLLFCAKSISFNMESEV